MTGTRLAALGLGLAVVWAGWGCRESAAADFSSQAAALPFPPDARELEFSAWSGTIRYNSHSPMLSLGAFYLKEMASRGWEHDEAAAEFDDDSLELTFKHGKSKVEIDLSQWSKEVRARLDCEGLEFAGVDDPAKLAAAGIPVPPATVFVQKEFTLPAGAEQVMYSGKGYMLKSTLKLAETYDHYVKQVQAKGFRESRKPIVTDTRLYSEFKKGAVLVSVNVFTDKVGSRIVLEHKDDKEPVRPPLAAVASLPIKNASGLNPTAPNPTGTAGKTGQPAAPAGGTPIDVAGNKGSASVTYAGKQYTFPYVASYQTKSRGSSVQVIFSAKPIPVNRMQTLIATKDDFSFGDLYEGSMPDRLILQLGERPSFMFGLSSTGVGNSVDDPKNEMKADGGRARGTLKMAPKEVFRGETLAFTATVDAVIITPTTRIAGPADAVLKSDQPILADSPIPFPDGAENVSREGSKFRKIYRALAPLKAGEVAAFFQKEAAAKGWKGVIDANAYTQQYKNDSVEVLVILKPQDNKTQIEVVARDVALAKKEGILPEAGKGRLLLANGNTVAVVFTIGKTDYPLKPGQGGQDLKQALNYSIPPATYTVVIKVAGQPPQTETIELAAGSTWGLIALPTGRCLPVQLY